MAQVEADASLAPIRLLDKIIRAAGLPGDQTGADQPTLRITGYRVLDLDDIGAPVRQHRARRRHERPRGGLDDGDTRQWQRRCHCAPAWAKSALIGANV